MGAFHLSNTKPAYYAIIPANVRYNETLTSTAKLLFGEITALANTQGFCNASNAYFARLYGITPKHVGDLISSLVGEGCVTVEVDQAAGNKRKVRIAHELNPDTYPEKSGDPSPEKSGHNNTSNNNIAHTSSTKLPDGLLKAYNLYLKYFIDKDPETAAKRYKLTPKRKAALERRLKDAEPRMVFAAIVGFGRADWSNGNNDRRWKADLADFICRSYENVERGARLYEEQRAGKPGEDAWANLH